METIKGITPYQQREQLKREISILQRSLDEIDINQEYCPYCGATQPSLYGVDGSRNPMRQYCECRQMRDHRRQYLRLNELRDQLQITEQRCRYRREKAEKMIEQSGIGKRFITADFENFDRDLMPKAFDIAFAYVECFDKNDGEGILFTGDVGTGKTHLAAAIAGEIIRRYSSTVEFVSYVEVLADMRAAFSNHTDKANRLEERMREAELLVIDDLGKEKPSQFTNEFLYRVINGRYKDKRPIIITTNLGLEELLEHVDYTVFSRIVDMCKAVEMRGNDYRMKDYLC